MLLWIGSLEEDEVVTLFTIVLDLLVNLGIAHPSDVILHGACHVKRWISDSVYSNLHMALLYIHNSILDRFRHLHLLHEHWQSTPSKGTDGDFLARC